MLQARLFEIRLPLVVLMDVLRDSMTLHGGYLVSRAVISGCQVKAALRL